MVLRRPVLRGCLLALTASLAYGVPGMVSAAPKVDAVKVDKLGRRLYLMSGGDIVRSFPVALGGNPVGHKRQEGDRRTPEGRYLLDVRKADSAYYRALHISYPDARDVADARSRGVSPGGAVMIHGQRNGFGWLAPLVQRFDWTDGCVALSNEDMEVVWTLVEPGTPVVLLP